MIKITKEDFNLEEEFKKIHSKKMVHIVFS